jgi:hypothetical protein
MAFTVAELRVIDDAAAVRTVGGATVAAALNRSDVELPPKPRPEDAPASDPPTVMLNAAATVTRSNAAKIRGSQARRAQSAARASR